MEAVPKVERPENEITPEQAFEVVFWVAYPRKTCKHTARKAWAALKLQADDQETLDAIMEGLARSIHQWELDGNLHDPERKRFIPHAATWLNQRRWEDEE